MIPIVIVVRKTGLITVAEAAAVVVAIQKQVSGEFAAAYRIDATIALLADGESLPAGAWPIFLLDESPDDGALGEHMDDSVPSGLVGVKTCTDDGVPWSSCLSHEVLELLADPWAELAYQRGPKMYAFEVCDPVEGAPYEIDGVAVENFVLPAWFRGGAGPYDHLGVLSRAGQLAPGGYMMSTPAAEWSQANAEKVRASKRSALPGSRRARRGGHLGAAPIETDIAALAEIFYNASSEHAGPATRLLPAWKLLDENTKQQITAGCAAVRDAIVAEAASSEATC